MGEDEGGGGEKLCSPSPSSPPARGGDDWGFVRKQLAYFRVKSLNLVDFKV